jgi:hypothetical protein
VTIIDRPSQNIDELFDSPWFSGVGLPRNETVPGVYQVAIGGHGYIIEPSKYQRVTVPLRRESTDESVEPGEQTLNTAGAWRRSQDNWFLGAGQQYLDNRFAFVSVYTHSGEDPSVRTRFWRSKGVNPWVEGALSLLPEYGQILTIGSGSICIAVGPYLYIWDGTTLKFTESPTYPSPTWTTVSTPTGGSWPTVFSMTTDGSSLFLALGNYGIAVTVGGATTSSLLRPTGPTPSVAAHGTTGSTSWEYFVVATDANGFKSLVSTGTTITNGNATLSSGNYNLVTWAAVEGAVSYDVLRGGTSTAIAVGLTGLSYTDNGSASTQAYTPPTTSTENLQANFVTYGNSFLLGGAGPLLAQVDANGMTTLVMQHFNPAFVWNAGCGSPVAIYVSGYAGNISELYGVQLSTTTFGLAPPYIAGQVSDGEIINDLAYYQGLVIMATSLGVRTAQDADQNGHLENGPVIEQLGASLCCVPWGAYVWFGVTDFAEADGIWPGTNISSGTGRLFLSEFSDALIPAYASDVLAPNGVTGNATSVAILGGTPYFTIDGVGLFGPTGNVVAEGYLEAGYVRYGTIEDKILISADVRHDPLPAESQVQIMVVPFGGASFLCTPSNEVGSIGPTAVASTGDYVGEAFQIIPVLTRSASNPAVGPVLRRWTVRALIIAIRQDQIIVPVIWRDEVISPVGDGTALGQDLVEEWKYLKALETSGETFIYQEGSQAYPCIIDQVELEAEKWNDQKTMLEGILSLKLLTVN